MAFRNESSPDYYKGTRRVVIGIVAVLLLVLFFVWRIDNTRVEQLRMSVVDRFAPSFEWTLRPLAGAVNMIKDVQSYARVYAQNEELRQELRRMEGWREAALQLEQKNARLLALNHVRLSPRITFVTAEVLADSGSPFRRSVMVNVGQLDGVADGSAVVDGLGLVGRIAGVGEHSARVILLSDGSSRVPATILPSGQRTLVTGDNGPAPVLEFLDQRDEIRTGDRVVTSGDGGLYPPDLLIGQVVETTEGRQRVRLASDDQRLSFVRVLRAAPPAIVPGPGELIGPVQPEREMFGPPSPMASR